MRGIVDSIMNEEDEKAKKLIKKLKIKLPKEAENQKAKPLLKVCIPGCSHSVCSLCSRCVFQGARTVCVAFAQGVCFRVLAQCVCVCVFVSIFLMNRTLETLLGDVCVGDIYDAQCERKVHNLVGRCDKAAL